MLSTKLRRSINELNSTPSSGPVDLSSPTFTLDNPNSFGTTETDYFGFAVGCSPSYTAVGAYQEDNANGTNAGVVYIYNNSTGSLLHTLSNPNAYNTDAYDHFGYSVDCSVTYTIAGAEWEDEDTGGNSGKAYIFDNATGNLLHTLDNPNAYNVPTGDVFGSSVACSETHAVVGAYAEDDGGNESGAIYIFNVVTGQLLHSIINPNASDVASSDQFGKFVDCNETITVVGNPNEDLGQTNAGCVYVFNNATGSLIQTISDPNVSMENKFGSDVSCSESYITVGASGEDDVAVLAWNSGLAYIFDVNTYELLHTLDDPNALGTTEGDTFGRTISCSDTYVVVGASGEVSETGSTYSGAAYIFDIVTGNLLHSIINPNPYGTGTQDWFSWSVACDGDYAVIGSWKEDDATGLDGGKAYLYKLV